MTSNSRSRRRPLAFVALLAVLLVAITVITLAQGPIVLGQPGELPGVLTLKPPDASGWYHLDNPGDQQLRFSGGGRPGQFLYMTIRHPGKITIYGDLEVTGTLQARSQSGSSVKAPPPPLRPVRSSQDSDAKADSANSGRYLQQQVDQLTVKVNELVNRVNTLSR